MSAVKFSMDEEDVVLKQLVPHSDGTPGGFVNEIKLSTLDFMDLVDQMTKKSGRTIEFKKAAKGVIGSEQ